MAKKATLRASSPATEPEPDLQQSDIKALATELFVRNYNSRQGFTLESSAEKAIEDAEAFSEILHR